MFCSFSSLEQRGDMILAVDVVVLREVIWRQPLVHHVIVPVEVGVVLPLGGGVDVLAEEDCTEEIVRDGEGDDNTHVSYNDFPPRGQHGWLKSRWRSGTAYHDFLGDMTKGWCGVIDSWISS